MSGERAAMIDRTEAWATTVAAIRDDGLKLAHHFERMETLRGELREAGLAVDAKLAPHVAAALDRWRAGRRENRASSEAPVTMLPAAHG